VLETTPKYFYFDYETTGLKPHKNGHRIPYLSFCTGGVAYSFPLQHKDFFTTLEQNNLCDLVREILTHQNIIKLAHNCKFEDMWTGIILGVLPSPWGMDTILAAHIFDNRRQFTGLKFQTYCHLGIPPYDSCVSGYLSGDTSNSFNKVEQIPVKDALTYSALDSKYGFAIFKIYNTIFNKEGNENLQDAYTLFHNGNLTFADIQANGVCVDEAHYQTQKIELSKQMDTLKKVISNSFEAKEFMQKYGKPLNIDSPKELVTLLVTILKYKVKVTDKGNHSVDKEVLEKIGSEFTLNIIKLRQLQQIVDTYIAQFEREMVEGKIYGSFDLNIPISYRSSSSNPNSQNVPIREKLAKEVCRGGLIPSKGNKILEADYGGIEVKLSACVHQDPNMIKYIMEDGTDMHRDTAADLFCLPPERVTKQLRQATKGGWVFPQFYGSWYKECATKLWEECVVGGFQLEDGCFLKEHLKINKIRNLKSFITHCKRMEDIFWGTRFKGYAQWKIDINNQYLRKGMVSNLFGFQFKGYMKENDVTNYPIQSAAFHCLLWSLNRVQRYILYHNLESRIIGQIHDSIVIDLVPDEETELIAVINYIGTILIKEVFDWIIVPLEIDFEITDVDKPWSTKKDIVFNEHHKLMQSKLQLTPDTKYLWDVDIWSENV